jgi:CRP-like cAMP-binding protein
MDSKINYLVEQLYHTEVFSYLTETERLELARLAVCRPVNKGKVLCLQGDDYRFVFYIASGALHSVISAPDGREHIVSTWEVGEVFWGHTLLDGDPMPSTLKVIKKSTIIYQWTGETVLELLLRNHNATRALLRRQTQLIRKRRENIYNLAFNPVASRLAKLILGKLINTENLTVQRDLTLEEMAAMIATSPEVICRIMYQFQTEGLLSIDRASITIQDHTALEKLILKD